MLLCSISTSKTKHRPSKLVVLKGIMGGNAVHIKEALIITPSQQTPSHVLPLSALDSQLFLRFTIEYLLVYRPSPALDRTLIASRFKSALARTLIRYYPLAGRVRPTNPQTPGGACDRLEVSCEAQGAVFVEATSDYTSADLDRAPRHVDERRDLLWFHVRNVLGGDPPLAVQLTWLADGSAALGFGFSHCLCDGIGSSAFLHSFAESTRGVFKCEPESIVWDRHLLDPDPYPVRVNPDAHAEFARVPDLCGFVKRFSTEPLVPTSNVFSRKQIKVLKRSASQFSGLTHTSFEVISGHVWTCWVKSLRLPPNQSLKLLFSVNIRNRVDKPGLPAGYYGNGFVLGCAKATAKEIAEKGGGYAAELIAKAKERVDEGYAREVVELVSQTRAVPDSAGVLVLSQWSRLGLEEADFFGLGKAVNVGPICVDRYCLLLPAGGRRRCAVKVTVALPMSAVDLYKELVIRKG